MAIRGYPYTLPIVCWGPATHAGETLAATALATHTQLGDYEYLRCGSIAFDDLGPGNITMELSAWADVPAQHRLNIQVYDYTNSLGMGNTGIINTTYASQMMSVNLATFTEANFPSGDARIILRYYLDLQDEAGDTAGALHCLAWRVRKASSA